MKFDFDANSKSKEQCKVISKICDRMNVLRCALLNKTEKKRAQDGVGEQIWTRKLSVVSNTAGPPDD